MKTVFGKVAEKEILTENGEVIDAIFGNKSVQARIVLSFYKIGTTNTLLKVITKKSIGMYFGE